MMMLPRSAHGEVKSYFMPLDELKARYGPEAGKRYGETAAAVEVDPKLINWNWSKLTLPRYSDLKNKGFSDLEIIEQLPWLNYQHLLRLKKKWGILNESEISV